MKGNETFYSIPWEDLPPTHYVDNRIFCDQKIFDIVSFPLFFVFHLSGIMPLPFAHAER